MSSQTKEKIYLRFDEYNNPVVPLEENQTISHITSFQPIYKIIKIKSTPKPSKSKNK